VQAGSSSTPRCDPRAGGGLAHSTLGVLAGSLAAAAGTVATRIVMARTLSPSALGSLLLAIAILSYAGGAGSLGTRLAAAQRIASLLARGATRQGRASSTFTVLVAAAGGVVAIVLTLVVCTLLHIESTTLSLLPVMAPVILVLAIGMAVWGVSQGYGDTIGRALFRDGCGSFLRLAGVALGALTVGTLPAVALGWTAGSVVGEASFLAYGIRKRWFGFFSGIRDKLLLRELPPYAGISILNQLRNWLDMFLLGILAEPAVLGIYGVAASFSRLLRMVQRAAAHRFLPDASASAAVNDNSALAATATLARTLTLAIMWPILAPAILVPEPLVVIPFGVTYRPAAEVLRILAVGFVVPALLGYTDEILLALGRSRAVLLLGQGGAVLTAVGMVVLVPEYGAPGAACAVSVSLALRSAAGYFLMGAPPRRAFWSRRELLRMASATLPAVGGWGVAASLGVTGAVLAGVTAGAAVIPAGWLVLTELHRAGGFTPSSSS
jgi:O-antigen/teichoic acid export membrane protein